MSAIAGILRLDGRPVDPDEVGNMLAIMAYRGPAPPRLSTIGAVCVGTLSNASRRTAQMDAEPMIAADARLDNIPDLARALADNGDAGAEALLTHAYEAWGEDCARRLLGDFALVIWDEQRHRMVCIRDHLGVRPMYYCHLPGQLFAFASEVKGLLTLPELIVRVDERRIADFLADHVADAQRTFYEDVRRLPPAHTLTVTTAGVSLRRYWAPNSAQTVRYSSDAEYAAAFREIFTEAVRCRLESATDLGVTLSGGLDSSSVTCMARHLLSERQQQLSTFSLLFSDTSYGDDRPFMTAVTLADDLRSDYVDVSELSPLRHLEHVSFHSDGPAYGQLASDLWEMYSRIATDRVNVLLDGCEGDVTISYNFRYLSELGRRLRWASMLKEARGLSRHYFDGKVSSRWVLKNYCLAPLLPSWAWRIRGTGPERGPCSLIAKRFAARSGLATRLEICRDEVASLHTHRDIHAYILAHPLVAQALENTDHLCAAFSIEPRHPFYDRRLVEFCLGLPRQQLVRDGWTRPILRRALADLLPLEVRRRADKGGSAAPRRLALLDRRVLTETAHDEEALGDYLDMGLLQAAIQRYLDGGSAADASAVWPSVSLRRWLRSTAFGSAPSPHVMRLGGIPTDRSMPD